jgi:hypothetical protein
MKWLASDSARALSSGLPLSAARSHSPSISAASPYPASCACFARQLAAELVHEVRQQAAAADLLQAIEHRLMHAAGPEGQPGLHRRAAYLAVIEVAADDGLQAFLRAGAGRACRRLNTASRSWPVMSRMVASSRPFLSLK